jgi:CRP/FNR family cyclic AMP-dependent transcriptional regulator
MPYNPGMSTAFPDLPCLNSLFSGLTATELERLAALSAPRRYAEQEYLTHAGDEWPCLFLVVEGCLSVFKESSEGRSLAIAELETGDVFWGLAFFTPGLPNPMSIQMKRPSQLIVWQRQDLLPYLLGNGSLAWELSNLLVQRMLHASQVIEGLAFQPVAGRLARLLMDFPGQPDRGPTARSLTLDDMAARIGSTREMVCRFLQKFADQGLIKITRTEFEITDREQLASMAMKEKA